MEVKSTAHMTPRVLTKLNTTSLEANMDDLYFTINFCRKKNPLDHE